MSGWYVLKDVCKNITLQNPDIIKATSQRDRVSTLFAGLYVPQQNRDLFYSHMGHSEQTNKEVTRAGKQLLNLDAGEDLLLFSLLLILILLLIVFVLVKDKPSGCLIIYGEGSKYTVLKINLLVIITNSFIPTHI